ncbi:hypothetical protein KPC83_04490 [Collinsella sp. zg1085]|uniref:hypothetical protein n=1 Tax=Collinsella sp. zg1085 TaxID=2844380 RepID=UPI001C0CB49D|nr:hypothetical protein [Collinsella sp. zg1085]QWT17110.1 hypothetical protein KPC83_04490 [Collinsella sp. zg1085]
MRKKLIRVLILIVIVCGYVYFNLKLSAVYYAQHTPHKERVEPVLMELVDSLYWAATPDIEGISYDYDGGNAIYNCNFKEEDIPLFESRNGLEYAYYTPNSLTFVFNDRFQLVRVYNDKTNSLESTDVDVNAIKRGIYKVVQPVIDAQHKPLLLNLQWLYDLLNKDRFN